MESQFIFGIHEPGGERHMAEAGRKGWIVFTEELGADPAVSTGRSYRTFSDQGFGVIVRLNNGYFPNGTIPNSQQYANFARRCANFVAASEGCKIWIIGNEMNYRIERPPIAPLRIAPEVPRPQNAPSAAPSNGKTEGLLAGLRRLFASVSVRKEVSAGAEPPPPPTPTPAPSQPGDPYGRGLRERFNAIYQPLPVSDANSRGAAAATVDGFEVITPALYARCFKLCRDAIRSVAGHANDQVLIGAVAPWNNQTAYPGNERGDWVRYFQDILTALGPTGLDGITLHTYTHQSDPNLISSEQRMNPPFTDRYFEFPAYRDFMNAIPTAMRSLPVYITETNQDVPWLNQNIGWIQRAYAEIDWWNQRPNSQQIRALVLYRWPVIDLWYIEGKGGVVEDFKLALQQDYRWRSSAPPPPTFAVNDIVATTTAVNIRRTPGYVGKAPSDILVQTPIDARFTILSAAPQQLDGLDWWQIRYSRPGQTPVVGWVAQRSPAGAELLRLVSSGGGGTGTFKVGDSVRTAALVRLRRTLGYINKPVTDIIVELPANTIATVVGGPTNFDSLIWWQLRVNNSGQEGWAAERSPAGDALLALNSTPVDPPTGKFKVNDRVVTVSAARLRQSPGHLNKPATDIVADIAQGVEGRVLDGPRQADSLTWWQLETTNAQGARVTGWMAESGSTGSEILRLSTGTTPPIVPGSFAPGDLVVATASVRVRATPGYLNKPDSDLRGDFLARTTINLLSGPQSVDSLAWWRVGGILSNGSEIVGWSAETAPSGAGLIGRPAKLAGTQIPDKATGAYLALPFQGSFGISQLWGENPDIYSRFTYDNVPLRGHNGIDFLTPIGTPVVAVDSGTVAETVVNDSTGFGQYIKVNHNWGEAFYGHLSGISVTPGQPVARGAVLGATGNTGFSFGPHLHFAIRINPYTRADGWGGFADPLPYFDPGAVQLPAYVTASRTAARLEAPSLQTPEGKVSRTLLAQKPGYAPDQPAVKRP